jgi:enoyl-[acyl-carrier-protein] reductase (NADH)
VAGLSLEGKRLLITGVLTKGSIAYTVAERAQEEGAQVVLTGFGRTRPDDRAGGLTAAGPAGRARARREQSR